MNNELTLPVSMAEKKKETIEQTFHKERKKLLGFIRQRVSDKEDAEDILQDVFFQLIENFNPIEPIEKVSAWLFRVARNKIIDKYRKKKAEPFSAFGNVPSDDSGTGLNLLNFIYDPHDNSDHKYLRSLVWDALGQALEELPGEQRQVFIWHELEGRDFKEISALTGDPVNTLISRKRYAVVYLRQQLQHLYNDLLKD
jgi:RNA polymerase sigma factor (sigma-70 family)